MISARFGRLAAKQKLHHELAATTAYRLTSPATQASDTFRGNETSVSTIMTSSHINLMRIAHWCGRFWSVVCHGTSACQPLHHRHIQRRRGLAASATTDKSDRRFKNIFRLSDASLVPTVTGAANSQALGFGDSDTRPYLHQSAGGGEVYWPCAMPIRTAKHWLNLSAPSAAISGKPTALNARSSPHGYRAFTYRLTNGDFGKLQMLNTTDRLQQAYTLRQRCIARTAAHVVASPIAYQLTTSERQAYHCRCSWPAR